MAKKLKSVPAPAGFTPNENQHLDFFGSSTRRVLWSNLYEGGARIEDNGQYLLRHPFETQKQFDIRKDRATYRNFAAPIVDTFAAAICEGRPPRVLPNAIEPMLTDVDRQGNSADSYFQDNTRITGAAGVNFILVDMEPGTGGSVEADKQVGRRMVPYFVQVAAENLLDWSIGADGELDWVVVREVVEARREPFQACSTKVRLTLWTRTGWQRWERVEGGNKGNSSFKPLNSGTHNLGRVPIVPFYFEFERPMVGNSALDDVATLILRIYRRDSELDKLLFDCAVPLLHARGVTQEEITEFVRASSNAFCTNDETSALTYVEPAGGSFEALSAAITRDEASVREIAMRQIRPDSGVAVSADGKKIDKSQLDSQLTKFAQLCRASEESCWRLAAKWLGLSDSGIEAKYNEDFSVDEVNVVLISALSTLQSNRVISRKTLLEVEAVKKALPENFDPVEDRREIEEDMRLGGAMNAGRGLGGILNPGQNPKPGGQAQ
ncbi:protein of unknown function [Humidesulfovibrio mexicanus]|uniref:DUF4055 domain-containing protein n=1 Tax=Humidesulfovibrio mexicanus TaxID=147047 RepID=A0A239AUQ6_9BACT|nr:DUF4055 domain-containing protein [Humidesulfovibrio mexicanus]SNR99445.1 protein of unknown function [Humidesulfovibrio mexicanus]